MKKIYSLLVMLAFLNILVFVGCKAQKSASVAVVATDQLIESGKIPAEVVDICRNGGAGSASCSIQPGEEIEGYLTQGCSVNCGPGYYACCGLRCSCRPVAAN